MSSIKKLQKGVLHKNMGTNRKETWDPGTKDSAKKEAPEDKVTSSSWNWKREISKRDISRKERKKWNQTLNMFEYI